MSIEHFLIGVMSTRPDIMTGSSLSNDPEYTHCGEQPEHCEICNDRVCDDCGKPRSRCVDRLTCEDCATECMECAQDKADDLAAQMAHERMRGLA